MECRAYGICLDSQSRGYLGKDRKVSSAAGGNLSRMHKTQETAKESRLNFMYSHLRNRTLVGANLNSLSNNTGLLLPCNQVLYRHRVVHSRQPALFKRRYHDDFGNSFSETQRSATPAKIMVRNPRPKVTIYRSNHVYQPVPHPGDQQREFLPEVFSFGSEIRNGFVLRPRRTHRNGARRPETKRSGKSQARGEVAA